MEAHLWKPNSIIFRHLLVVPVLPLSQQVAASFHASGMPSAKRALLHIVCVHSQHHWFSPVAVKQLDSILVSLWLALGIKSLRIEFKSGRIRGLAAQYFTQDTAVCSLPSFFVEERLSSLAVITGQRRSKN
jgi:hypothetical protein